MNRRLVSLMESARTRSMARTTYSARLSTCTFTPARVLLRVVTRERSARLCARRRSCVVVSRAVLVLQRRPPAERSVPPAALPPCSAGPPLPYRRSVRCAQVDFYVNCKLEERSIPFRRTSSSFIGACALGNRDTCTTWFDTFTFTHEEDVCINQLPLVEGRAAGWCAPSMRDHPIWLHAVIEPNRAGESVRAKADALVAESPLHVSAPGAFSRLGPVTPMCAREVAQRIALNEAALHNLRSMLDDEATADVVLNVEGERIYAHRCVLVSRCETFKLMLSSGLAEGRPAAEHSGADGAALPRAGGEGASARSPLWTITVHETEPTVFRKMLEFLYAGAVDIDPEHAPDLLALADQYMLPGLKLLCGFALKQSITIETVCRIYQSADRFDCKGSELKQQCLNFILHNYDAIVKTDHWDELTASPHLLVEVTRAVASTRKEGSPSGPHNQRKRARD